MKLEKQVCSLKLSKKLKKLGVKQESLFSWLKTIKGWRLVASSPELEVRSFYVGKELASAFTVAELGEMLKETRPELDNPFPSYGLITKRWFLLTEDGNIEAKTEANARAKTIIYLKGI